MSNKHNTLRQRLITPYEVQDQLDNLSGYTRVCYSELLEGLSLTAMNQRKQRAVSGENWTKMIDISLAVELYKLTVKMNEKGAI
ncbi:hypothetical protein VPIG_00077 [Vibrio phage PWH3a-P1]|uniref:hypothetical protein n=1 Tax=Vibrio phage PWH3a-P1 TaxID=754058 RepID=UPI0002C069C5|nr:hypothetical protein VPIG_00077 [Vibrio phage PWH3a-P1]AGH31935.1 hypothetical protein VPIG_00077 [Vibrio phage PWH3a-P1]